MTQTKLSTGDIRGAVRILASDDKVLAASEATLQKLESKHPTYIEIPKHLCPAKWSHMRRPVCKLVKALYGHPESGGHWERYLTDAIKAIGGLPMFGHPSCFWFEAQRMLLTVYVDDLLLSGPATNHQALRNV